MAEILRIPNFITKVDIHAPSMLREIAKENPDYAFVIVWPKDGSLPTFHSNTSDMPVILMQLQRFIHLAFSGDI